MKARFSNKGRRKTFRRAPRRENFTWGRGSSSSMALEIRQVQKLAQQLVMTPQLQQAIKLLQLSRVELEDMVTKELQENPALEEGPAEESESGDQPRGETAGEVGLTEPVVNRELSAVDKIGTYDWQEYLDTHSNSMHGSLTAEAGSDDGDAPPSWENSLTKKTSLEDHSILRSRWRRRAQSSRVFAGSIAKSRARRELSSSDSFGLPKFLRV